MAASQSQTGGDGGDCYYLLMRDRERTARMVQQLVDTLQQVFQQHLNWLPFNGHLQPGSASNSNSCDLDDKRGRLFTNWPGAHCGKHAGLLPLPPLVLLLVFAIAVAVVAVAVVVIVAIAANIRNFRVYMLTGNESMP